MTTTLFLAPLVKRDFGRKLANIGWANTDANRATHDALLRGFAEQVAEKHGVSMDAAMAALRESVL